jgi:hypothetical protein
LGLTVELYSPKVGRCRSFCPPVARLDEINARWSVFSSRWSAPFRDDTDLDG